MRDPGAATARIGATRTRSPHGRISRSTADRPRRSIEQRIGRVAQRDGGDREAAPRASLFLVKSPRRVAQRDGEERPEQPFRDEAGEPRADEDAGNRAAQKPEEKA